MCFENMGLKDNTYACLNADGTKLFKYLDNAFKSFMHGYNVEEYHIPALIDGGVLQKCGYFDSFPQHLTVAAHINEFNFNDVVNDKSVKDDYLASSNKFLTPAACLHIYPMLENSKIEDCKVITTEARVYRYENGKFKDITRLWDFTVREIIFVGSPDFVQNGLNNIKEKALQFAKKISEDASIVSASDNFYPSSKNKMKARIQKSNSLKYELTIPVKDERVACASFNYHDYHFSKPFNFDNESTIVTGCVGFGMERWIAACIEHDFNV